MICPTCNASNADAARFCSGCGLELHARRTLPPQNPIPEEEEITRQDSGRAVQEATVLDREADPLLGSTIAGKYRFDAKLGEGGMGAVYSASRLLIGDLVAVKILHSEQRDAAAPERFRREAQAAALLKHPNAVSIYDFGITDDGLQYLVMELVEGDSLRRIIKQQGPLTPSASAEIINQVCAALDEAHRHNIIHRDIKPDNIIVNVTATNLRVKVLDFGIAKLRDDVAGNLTQTGSMLGTPRYMSPEQCLGEELDNRSDIYSLGVVLYEMLTGLVPFNSPTSAAVVVQQVTQPPPPLRSLNASISPAVETIVLRALQKQRDARPQTAAEFALRFSDSIEQAMKSVPLAGKQALTGESLSGNFGLIEPTVVVSKPGAGQFYGTQESVSKPRAPNILYSYIAVGLVTLILGGALVAFLKSQQRSASSNAPFTPTNSPTIPPRAADPAEQVAPFTETDVGELLESWRKAWETKNLYAYANYYDENFIGRNYSSRSGYTSMTRVQWLEDKEQKFRRNPFQSVTIFEPTIRRENDGVTVVFHQEFESSAYSDKGTKTLYLRKSANGEIKILREDFIPDGGGR